jgi:serine/threonine protein kinase
VYSSYAGKGAFGIVKLGINKKTGEQVAIKSISKAKLVCKEDVKDVQAEVAIMNLVAGHVNVVSLKVGSEQKHLHQHPSSSCLVTPFLADVPSHLIAEICRALLRTRRQFTSVWSSALEASSSTVSSSQATLARRRQHRWACRLQAAQVRRWSFH